MRYTDLLLDNAAYDPVLKKVFLNAFNETTSTNSIAEVTPGGQISTIVDVPGIVQVCISTYCPVGHIFFLTLQIDGDQNNLVRVDVKNQKVIANVSVPDTLELIMWDHTSATLYAWIADENFASILCTIDPDSGKRLTTMVQFSTLTANGGTSILDIEAKKIFSTLMDLSQPGNPPVWVVFDLATNNVTKTPFDVAVGWPINLVNPI